MNDEPDLDLILARKIYLDDLQARNYSVTTIAGYRKCLLRFEAFLAGIGITRPQEVTADHLAAYRLASVKSNIGQVTLAGYLRIVRRLFSFLEKHDYIFANPTVDLIIRTGRSKIMPVPTKEEVDRLLARPDIKTKVGLRDRALLETAYTTAIRQIELLGLSLDDLDLSKGVLRIKGKGGNERAVPLGKQALHFLKLYLDEVRPVFVRATEEQALFLSSHTGKRLSKTRTSNLTYKYAATARIETPMSIHALRRACATHMLRNGAHPVAIQALLGHADLKNLGRYLRTTITELKKTHARSKIGQ